MASLPASGAVFTDNAERQESTCFGKAPLVRQSCSVDHRGQRAACDTNVTRRRDGFALPEKFASDKRGLQSPTVTSSEVVVKKKNNKKKYEQQSMQVRPLFWKWGRRWRGSGQVIDVLPVANLQHQNIIFYITSQTSVSYVSIFFSPLLVKTPIVH